MARSAQGAGCGVTFAASAPTQPPLTLPRREPRRGPTAREARLRRVSRERGEDDSGHALHEPTTRAALGPPDPAAAREALEVRPARPSSQSGAPCGQAG